MEETQDKEVYFDDLDTDNGIPELEFNTDLGVPLTKFSTQNFWY